MEEQVKLNLGCGSQVIPGWINVDYSLGARLIKLPLFGALNKRLKLFEMQWDDRIFLHNLTTKFPWDDGAVDIIYSSHTLEHMDREQGMFFLSECNRVLKLGGLIRIIVPDLAATVKKYLRNEILAENFVDELGVLYLERDNRLKNMLSPFIQFPHKCMYDSTALIRVLGSVGFEANPRGGFESEIDDIKAIEMQSRVCDAVIVEGRKV